MSDAGERAAVAARAAEAGADVAHASFRSELSVERKSGKNDVVTRADGAAQDRVSEVVADAFPGEVVVGEEGDAAKTVPETGPAWVVDPIDGTNNYVRGMPFWGTAVAAVRDGEAVAAATVFPALGDAVVAGPDGVRQNGEAVAVSDRSDPEEFRVAPTYWWTFDQRDQYSRACEAIVTEFGDLFRLTCIQYALALVAAGSIEAVVTNHRPNAWDSVAGAHMVERAGGTVTDAAGDPWRSTSGSLVASNGPAHDEVRAVARAADGDTL